MTYTSDETSGHWDGEKYQCSNNSQLFRSGEGVFIAQLFPWVPSCPLPPALLAGELPDVGFLEGSLPADYTL